MPSSLLRANCVTKIENHPYARAQHQPQNTQTPQADLKRHGLACRPPYCIQKQLYQEGKFTKEGAVLLAFTVKTRNVSPGLSLAQTDCRVWLLGSPHASSLSPATPHSLHHFAHLPASFNRINCWLESFYIEWQIRSRVSLHECCA